MKLNESKLVWSYLYHFTEKHLLIFKKVYNLGSINDLLFKAVKTLMFHIVKWHIDITVNSEIQPNQRCTILSVSHKYFNTLVVACKNAQYNNIPIIRTKFSNNRINSVNSIPLKNTLDTRMMGHSKSFKVFHKNALEAHST